jgi:hypothetical protein
LPGQGGDGKDRPRRAGLAEIKGDIAALVKLSTRELRGVWRKLHRTGPPLGLSRDLMIRTLANNLQERAHDGPSRALRRRLQTLAGEFENGAPSFGPWRAEDRHDPWCASGADTLTRYLCTRMASSTPASAIAR